MLLYFCTVSTPNQQALVHDFLFHFICQKRRQELLLLCVCRYSLTWLHPFIHCVFQGERILKNCDGNIIQSYPPPPPPQHDDAHGLSFNACFCEQNGIFKEIQMSLIPRPAICKILAIYSTDPLNGGTKLLPILKLARCNFQW